MRGMVLPMQGDRPQRAPSPEATPHTPASRPTALNPQGAPGFPRVCSSGASAHSVPLGPCSRAVRSGLMRGVPGGLCSQRALQGDLPRPASTPPLGQVTTPASATLRITPPFTTVWTFPDFISMLLLSVGKLTRISHDSFFLGCPLEVTD